MGEPYTFKGLARGVYELWSGSIGYKRRLDTFHLFTPPGLEATLRLRPDTMCLDLCDANPALVAAALAAQDEWVCDRDPKSLDNARVLWSRLLTGDQVRAYLGHRIRQEDMVGQLRRVGNDAECRRMAIASDLVPTSLAFSVFRWSGYTMVADLSQDEAIILDRQSEPVGRFHGGGFAYWLRPKALTHVDRRLDSLVYRAVLDSLFPARRPSTLLIHATTASFLEPETITEPTFQARYDAFPRDLMGLLVERSKVPYQADSLPVAGKRLVTGEELRKAYTGGWNTFYEQFPGSIGILSLSRIAWSADERSALVYYDWICGDRCGERMLVLVEWAPDGTWTATRRLRLRGS